LFPFDTLDDKLESLISISKNFSSLIILNDEKYDYKLVSPIYDYHSLYMDGNLLCGNYDVYIDDKCFGITTFEIPVFNGKVLSKELIRFINRSLNVPNLILKLKHLSIKGKYLIDILVKNKKTPDLFKKQFQNMEILG